MSHERLTGAWNFRDVAETAGILPGRLFRSSELSRLAEPGRRTLLDLGVTDVADLRSPVEIERRGPGAVPDAVTVHNLPFPEASSEHRGAPHEASWRRMMAESAGGDSSAAAARWMRAEYERFPILDGARTAVRRIITLAGADRPVLVHCFAGKDRTGFAVAVALEAAGIPRDTVVADYLRSNDAIGSLREAMLAAVRDREDSTDESVAFAASQLTDAVLGVREEYLAAAWRVLDETYGGLVGYLTAAGVTADDVARLRSRLLG